MKALKVARLTKEGFPVYDCTVFAATNSHISVGNIHITGDFICNDAVVIEGNIFADGVVSIGTDANMQNIYAGEGIYIGDDADVLDVVSSEDIEVGDNAELADVRSYRNVKIGDNPHVGEIEVWTGDFEIGPNESTGKIQVGKLC